MIDKVKKRIGSDRADSMVSAVFVLPMLFFMLVTTVDFGIYLSNRGQIQAIARDGARTVAIMGGDGSATLSTSLEYAYGQDRATACNGAVTDQYTGNISSKTSIECNVIKSLNSNANLVNVEITNVACGPLRAEAIGEKTYCAVYWVNNGIPGSAMSFTRGQDHAGDGLGGTQITRGSGESEVKLGASDMTSRR